MLHDWTHLFEVTGAAGGELIGLLFVVVTLGTGLSPKQERDAIRAFITPTVVNFSAVPKDYDPTDRRKVAAYLDDQPANAVVTGLLYIDPDAPDMHELAQSSLTPLRDLPYEKLCPGSADIDGMASHCVSASKKPAAFSLT